MSINLLEYLNKTTSINAKAKIISDDIIKQRAAGTIKTNLEMFYVLKNTLTNFFNTLNKPLYSFIKAKGSPISSDYNTMMKNACSSISVLNTDYNSICNTLNSSFNDITVTKNMYDNIITNIDQQFKNISDSLNNLQTNNMIFADYFTSNINTNTDSNAANVDVVNNILTLPVNNYENAIDKNTHIEITNNSNGFPGNTHCATIMYNGVYFNGQDNLHLDLNEIIDGKEDTWFEYEVFKVSQPVLNDCNGYGFDYKEGAYWITQENSLSLELLITLTKSKDINFLDISPLINIDRLNKPFTLNQIRLYSGSNLVKKIDVGTQMNQKYTVTFDRTTVTTIYFTFVQQNSYETDTGHYYKTDSSGINSNIFDSADTQKRIECEMPSIESLGIKYDPKTKSLINAKNYTTDGDYIINTNDIQNSLFNIPSLKDSMEIVKANRFAIGIRDISLALCEYGVSGVYISPTYNTKNPISKITLEVDEYVPSNFPSTLEYVQYFISLDDGENWLKILPRQKGYMLNGSLFTSYCINSDIPKGLRSSNTYYIDTLLDLYSVKFMISMSRPSGDAYLNEGPIVYDYRLNVVSDGDYID